ncbi:uncharacterized protein BDV17DRAFT_258632, partial [Aspergillus undulatus]|uniref:uncharacterized protein n=1 Tax=Aspergillus undulatus TaxID=1810928 RepID=UPI003CCDFAA6
MLFIEYAFRGTKGRRGHECGGCLGRCSGRAGAGDCQGQGRVNRTIGGRVDEHSPGRPQEPHTHRLAPVQRWILDHRVVSIQSQI